MLKSRVIIRLTPVNPKKLSQIKEHSYPADKAIQISVILTLTIMAIQEK